MQCRRFYALWDKVRHALGDQMTPPRDAAPAPVLVFDACHVGLVLRSVLAVELILAVGVMFVTRHWGDWFLLVATITAAALPATLLWLLIACAFKRPLQRCARVVQYGFAIGLGAVAGLYACMMALWMGLTAHAPWLAGAIAGGLFAAAQVALLIWRAQRRAPAGDAARLTELQARIRPHFLFNTLNSAIALVRAEPARAERMLEDLSELFRSALSDQGEAISLAQELEWVKRYLAIEQARFATRLRVQWKVDPRCLEARLPPLILQPLVENAVIHGVEPSASGADIEISVQKQAKTVVIQITNGAPGGQGAPGQGMALKNVRERLQLLHDVQARFRCTWSGGVFQVTMEIPA